MEIVCKNCNHTFDGNFCNFCGQSARTHKINKDFLLHDIVLGLFSFDKGISFTIKELFTHPGLAIKDFLNGKRISYFKPTSFVFLLAGIYSFIILYFNIDVTHLSAYESDTEGPAYRMTVWMTNHFAFISLMFIPVSALSSFLAFRKNGYNYVEHIVINSYLSGLSVMVAMLLLPIIVFVPREYQWGMSVFVNNIGSNIFRFWAFYQIFSDLKPIKRIRKILLSCVYYVLLFLIVIVIFGIAVGFIWIFLLQNGSR